jgi:hypothetical protein
MKRIRDYKLHERSKCSVIGVASRPVFQIPQASRFRTLCRGGAG